MKIQVVRYVILTLLMAMSSLLLAAKPDQRSFDKQKLEQERTDHSYYIEQPEKEKTENKAQPVAKPEADNSFSFDIPAWIVYTVAFILLAILIAVLFNMSFNLPFASRDKKDDDDEHGVHENIHDIDFNKAIQDAINNGDYRKAIRLYYLLSLKLLSEKKLIHWQAHKTNREYIRELRATELKYKLEEVTYMFELIWYGEVEMNKNVFEEVLTEVRALHQSIKAVR